MNVLSNHWKDLLALAAAIAAVWKYLETRRRELAWERTKFLFAQAEKLESDPEI